MNVKANAEKEWLRKMTGGKPVQAEVEKMSTTAVAKADDKPVAKATRNGFKDVAGMDDLKQLVTEGFINVLNNRECAKAFGVTPPSLLFYGPAGCGKTFFAEKVAEEVGVNFIKVVPDDIASTLVHGTQEKIGALFAAEKGIYVLAATNHPERIDRAVLRTGRIDELIYVDMPDFDARESLFKLTLSKLPTAEDIDYARLADMTKGYNCSDISYIIKTASRKMFNASIQEKDKPYKVITQALLEEAILHKSPSVSSRDLREYERLRCEFSPKDKECKRQAIGFH